MSLFFEHIERQQKIFVLSLIRSAITTVRGMRPYFADVTVSKDLDRLIEDLREFETVVGDDIGRS